MPAVSDARRIVRPLAIARVALGVVFLVRTTAIVDALPLPLAHVRGPLLGWPEPGAAFAWGGLVLPPAVDAALAIARTLAAALVIVGVRARAAGVAAGLLGFVALSQDPFGFVFTLHALFLGTIVLALGDASTDLALVPDAPLDPRDARSARSSRGLLCVFVASIYAWSAIAKLGTEWLSGRTLLALAEDGLVTPWLRSALLAHGALRVASAWSVTLVEAGLAVAMLVPRAARAALVFGLAFHVALEIATRPDVMGFVMGALLVGAAYRPR